MANKSGWAKEEAVTKSTAFRIIAKSLICFLLILSSGAAQTQPQRSQDQINRSRSEPYRGDLSIFEDPKRAEKLQIDRVMDLLGIKTGSNVADIGAGSGWFTVRAARRVGPAGLVYAVEINTEYLKYIEERAKREGFDNIKTVLGKDDDPMLSPNSIDAVLLLKTYHEIAEPIILLRRLTSSLRPGALVGIIDKNGKGNDHGLNKKVVIEEMKRAGFSLVSEHDFVKPDGMDYFLIFSAGDGGQTVDRASWFSRETHYDQASQRKRL